MYSHDFRWRAIVLLHVYGVNIAYVSDILGPKVRTLERWYSMFLERGEVRDGVTKVLTSRWSPHVLADVSSYVKAHPTFFLEELRAYLHAQHPNVMNTSLSTICRALNFDLNLSRKVLTKAARECVPQEVENYKAKLEAVYSYPQQLLFIDETSKDGRHAYRRPNAIRQPSSSCHSDAAIGFQSWLLSTMKASSRGRQQQERLRDDRFMTRSSARCFRCSTLGRYLVRL
jgi:transposase